MSMPERAHQEVARRAHTHEVPRPLRVDLVRDLAERLDHLRDGLADREPAEREPVERELPERLGVREPQIRETCTLHDSEERLTFGPRRGERPLRPGRRALDGPRDEIPRRLARGANVELHLDVGADAPLDVHGHLGREPVLRAVEVRAEGEPVLVREHEALGALALFAAVSLFGLRERERLEAPRVGEHRVRPAGEAVKATVGRDRLGAGAEPEVVGVAEHDLGAGARHLLGRERLHRALGADGHEGRRLDDGVRGREGGGARVPVARVDVEREPWGPGPHEAPTRERNMASP
jgi:hypothetical protein